jgi:hypothetical protein
LIIILGESDAGAGEQQRSKQSESSGTSIHIATSPFGWLTSLGFDSKDPIFQIVHSPVTALRKVLFHSSPGLPAAGAAESYGILNGPRTEVNTKVLLNVLFRKTLATIVQVYARVWHVW